MTYFNRGDLLSIRGSSPYWTTLQKDVEIIAIAKLSTLIDIGIDYYSMYFSGNSIDELYQTYVDSDIEIYMAREIIRDPFQVSLNTDAPKVQFVYFSDEILDMNATEFISKRSRLKLGLTIGNFNSSDVTEELKDELSNKFQEIIDDYTSTGVVGDYTEQKIAQDQSIADSEDTLFQQLKDQREAEAQAIADAEAQREADLVARETAVTEKEAELTQLEADLDSREVQLDQYQTQLDEQADILQAREDTLNSLEDTLTAQQLEINNQINILTEQSQLIRDAVSAINDKEAELGIPLTSFSLGGLIY